MRVGVFSDTHDHLVAIDRALRTFEGEQVEAVVHAGDIGAPFALKFLVARLERLGLPLYIVFGNNDGERHGLATIYPRLRDGPYHFALGSRKVCLIHDPARLRHEDEMSADILITGHTHRDVQDEMKDGRLYINPAETCGWLTGQGRVTILDTEALTARSITVHQQERPTP